MDYKDIYIVPQHYDGNSRNEVNLSIELGGHTFRNPIIPANMGSIISIPLAKELEAQRYFYVLHRFMPYEEIVEFCATYEGIRSISVGIKDEDRKLIMDIANTGAVDYITVDVAHGYQRRVKEMIEFIRHYLPDVYIIAGNVGSVDGCRYLEWFADAIKVGIARGSACGTYEATGVVSPMFSTVLECAKVVKKPIIADGGTKTPGDIAKALVAGAHMVMVGNQFAGHNENGNVYAGSTAYNIKYNEGKVIQVELKGSIFDTYRDMEEKLVSSCTYCGGTDLSAFSTKGEWRKF